MRLAQQGLNRIEVMILVVTIAILAGVAIPAYLNYTAKPDFAVVINAVVPYRIAIEACVQDGTCVIEGKLSSLSAAKLGVPAATPSNYLASIMVAPNGTITAIASDVGGLSGESYVLTPNYTPGGNLSWASSGTCKTRAAGPLC